MSLRYSRAQPEPLLWEAKGKGAEKHHVIKTVCGFANSHDGGWLILGADETERDWKLPGIELPDEPAVWIANIVGDNLRPAPSFDVRSFPINDDRHIVIVQVEPLGIGPCIARGTVYERVPGKSVSVKEPLRLAELYRLGDSARKAALLRSHQACDQLLHRNDLALDTLLVAVGVSALTYTPDISSRLFTEATDQALFEATRGLPGASYPNFDGMQPSVWGQDAITAVRDSASRISPAWQLRAQWDGAVGVLHALAMPWIDAGTCVNSVIEPAWRAALSIAAKLGGKSGQYLTVKVAGAGFFELGPVPAEDRPAACPSLSRRPLELSIDSVQLQSLSRELGRVRGERSPEPADEPGTP